MLNCENMLWKNFAFSIVKELIGCKEVEERFDYAIQAIGGCIKLKRYRRFSVIESMKTQQSLSTGSLIGPR